MDIPSGGEATQRNVSEREADAKLKKQTIDFLTNNSAIANSPHWNWHLSAFLRRQTLSRVLYLNDLYQKIVDVPGVILEFGVQHGATLSVLANLRGIHEPFNHSRKIIGFDTFEGFPSVNPEKDGDKVAQGMYNVEKDWSSQLSEILTNQQKFSPIEHITKFELVVGRAEETLKTWLKENPGLAVAMLILDMDIYEPTKEVLELLKPRLTSRSLLVFDEFSCAHFAGETIAASEVFGLGNLDLYRSPLQPFCAYGYVLNK